MTGGGTQHANAWLCFHLLGSCLWRSYHESGTGLGSTQAVLGRKKKEKSLHFSEGGGGQIKLHSKEGGAKQVPTMNRKTIGWELVRRLGEGITEPPLESFQKETRGRVICPRRGYGEHKGPRAPLLGAGVFATVMQKMWKETLDNNKISFSHKEE